MNFPSIDPIALQIGPIAIRWYALAYITGLLIGWVYVRHLARTKTISLNINMIDDLLVWIMVGVILGGRFGYVIFYQAQFYIENPMAVFAVWQGGMSFHGGLIGVVVALYWFARRRQVGFFSVADAIAPIFPFGLMLGRISNFVNGELFGRFSDVPWAIVFPQGGNIPRHPSQLYEAFLEGALLLCVMLYLVHARSAYRKSGLLSGVFLLGYSVARIVSEIYRQPDQQIGFIWSYFTMGQVLSVPLGAVGLFIIVTSKRRTP